MSFEAAVETCSRQNSRLYHFEELRKEGLTYPDFGQFVLVMTDSNPFWLGSGIGPHGIVDSQRYYTVGANMSVPLLSTSSDDAHLSVCVKDLQGYAADEYQLPRPEINKFFELAKLWNSSERVVSFTDAMELCKGDLIDTEFMESLNYRDRRVLAAILRTPMERGLFIWMIPRNDQNNIRRVEFINEEEEFSAEMQYAKEVPPKAAIAICISDFDTDVSH